MKNTKQGGFTLIELSIVLVIIGFITGGVLVGRDMIRAAQIRKTVRQIEQLDAAVNTFRLKYNCLPGDCINATNFGFATVYHDSGVNINGTGNKQITADNGESYQAVGEMYEMGILADVKQHAYCCVAVFIAIPAQDATNGYQGIIDINYMKMDGALPNVRADGHYYWLRGAPYVVTSGSTNVLLPQDAYEIDVKLDDGFPRSGRVLSSGRAAVGSATSGYFPAFDPAADVGAAGASSNYCVTNDATPLYNTLNVSRAAGSLCTMTVKAPF